MHADVVVVGAGLTGATVARRLADQGLSVLVLERRAQVGGNCADIRHEPSGLLVNKHGPHYFRTGSKRIWEFVCQYAAFVPFAARVRAHADGELHRWPIALQQVVRSQHHPSDSHATNFEDVCIARFGQKHYDMLIGPYTKKQWGVEPSTLSADLARRIELRLGDDDRLMTVPYQGVPLMGYSAMVRSMLFGVDTLTGVDWLKTEVSAPVVVYTGAIDEFFDYAFGRLRYRSQRRVDVYHSQKPMHQGFVQINYPSPDVDYVRAIEWRHMRKEKHATGTVVTYEYPQDAKSPDEAEYPFPDEKNRALYHAYARLAEQSAPHVVFAGRLGTYAYLDMDAAIARAMKVADALLQSRHRKAALTNDMRAAY